MLLFVVLAGCATAQPDPTTQMCSAASRLEAARTVAVKAMTADGSGLAHLTQTLAHEAAASAQEGHDLLQAVSSDDVRRAATWQALLVSYMHVGQAANALLSDDAGTRGTSAAELVQADAGFATAARTLPAGCFVVGVNQPASAQP